jgi:lysyl endopeptidase
MDRVFLRLVRGLAGLAAALALAGGAQAAQPWVAQLLEGSTQVRAEPKIQPLLPAVPAPIAQADLERAAHVTLAPAPKRFELQSPETAPIGAPVQVGFARAVDSLATPLAVSQALDWQDRAGAQVAAITVSSPGALGLRAGIVVDSLPDGAALRFYAPGSTQVFAAAAAEIAAAIERNRASGDASDAARTFWSPVVEGDTLAVEVELPRGTAASALRISIPTLSHFAASPRDAFVKAAASSCELDAMCYQPTWSLESNAVSRIVFTDSGSSFLCTGTLLADRDANSVAPYFLTANHCVTTQTVASTVQNYWFWRSIACDSTTRGAAQTTFGGGTLLYASAATDTSFMRLNTAPPAGTAYAGWIANEPAQGTSVTGIHHPAGDLQKISFGNVASFWTCQATKPGDFTCNGASAAAATFMGVSWRSGITEGGSSGSPLFTDTGHYLVGQLYGGNGSCSAPGTDFYGRFDLAYNAGISQWLGLASTGGATPAANYTDLWWNAAESGWGLSLTQHGSALFAAWFVYDANGRSTWYVIPGGTWATSTSFTGDVYSTTGPDPMAASFDPTRVVRTKVGTGTLRFPGTTQGTFAYTVNGISEQRTITRQPFGGGDAVTNGYGDLWWTANESGWGLSLTQQGNAIFGVWYSYAPDGTPTWYVLPTGTWTSGDTYTGRLYRTAYSGGAFLGHSFNAAGVTRTDVGSITLRFIDAGTAQMSYSVDGISGTKQITRQPF